MHAGGRQHPIETLVEWLAPIPLALAVAWATSRLGLSLTAAAAAGVLVMTAGNAAIRVIGRPQEVNRFNFEPPCLVGTEPVLGELLLEEKDEVLLLDDPLEEPGDDSRVVRLFSRQQPTPGELVGRIEDFLGEARQAADPPASPPSGQLAVDASSDLYAALANIRASLR